MHKLEHESLPRRVADRLQSQIIEKRMGEGDRLPTEPELMALFGVSRTVVREAAALLVSRGLVDVKPRRGMTVRAPDGSGVAESLAAQLQMSRVSLDQLLEVRLTLESSMAQIAAANRTDGDLDRLDDNLALMADPATDREATVNLDIAFHEAIADATHNPFFQIVIRPINDLLRALYIDKVGYMSLRGTTVDEHRAIVEAIRESRPDEAVAATRAHLERVGESVRGMIASSGGGSA